MHVASLQTPLAKALGPLNLSEPVRQALLQGQGPYAEYLLLAQALDGDDADLTDRLAQPFGGAEVVRPLAQDAWVWAQEMARGAAAED